MKRYLFFGFALVTIARLVYGEEPSTFDTRWISPRPEVLTYKSTSPQGSGLYQVSLSKGDTTLEIYISMISPGFTKTVSGTMSLTILPGG